LSQRVTGFLAAHWRPLTLLAISILLTAVYIVGRPYILYNDGDPLTYFRKAWWFLGRGGGIDVPSRGPGYPLWLIVTGAATFDTWWPLLLSQAAMAAAVPLLAYGILAPVSRNAGFVAGLLFMTFAISYKHMSWIMTEELCLFVQLLAILLISRHLCAAWPPPPEAPVGGKWGEWAAYRARTWLRTPYPIALLLAFGTMVKPALSPFFWIFLLVCLVFRPSLRKAYIGPVVCYAAIMTAWASYDYHYGPVRFPNLLPPGSEAQRYFADTYYGEGFGSIESGPPTIAPESGPASRELYRLAAEHVAATRENGRWNSDSQIVRERLYTRFATTDSLVQELFTRPSPLYFGLLVSAAARGDGDRLLYQVAREHGKAGLIGFAKYVAKHPTIVLKGPPNPYPGYMFLMKYYRYRENLTAGIFGMRNLFLGSFRENLLRDEFGPGVRQFKESIRYFVETHPELTGLSPDDLRELGGPEGLIQFVMDLPYDRKYAAWMSGAIYGWMALIYGDERTGRLMGNAALAITSSHYVVPGFLLGDLLDALAFPENSAFSARLLYGDFQTTFLETKRNAESELEAVVGLGRINSLPPRMAGAVGRLDSRSQLQSTISTVMTLQYGALRWAKPIMFFVLVVFGMALVVARIGGALVVFLVACFFVSAAAWSVVLSSPGGDMRHEDIYAFIPILVGMLGITSLPRLFRLATDPAPDGALRRGRL
jgi:hypothetical protein